MRHNRILVTGSRTWKNEDIIKDALLGCYLEWGTEVLVQGGANGADKIAAEVGKSIGLHVITVKADWDSHGKKAGHIRNQLMLDKFGPYDKVLAFKDKPESRGTDDMIRRCRDAGYEVTVFTPDGGHYHLTPFTGR